MFTADDEQIFTVTLDLPVQACKNASLSLANVAWYVLRTVQTAEPIECIIMQPRCLAVSTSGIVLFILY